MSNTPRFVHLHLHSEYSLLDGGNRMGPLIKKVKELGMDAVALTDHGNLYGAVDFYRTCRKHDLKPILGIEAYVAPDIKNESSDRRHKEFQGVADGGFHLVLLAENNSGWNNLIRLSSDAFLEGFYYKPRMDKQTLTDWNEGLIAINGHLGSSLAYHLDLFERSGDEAHYRRAVEEAQWHHRVFAPVDGRPRFFLELQRHETPEQHAINAHILRLASELDLPYVCDNDAHFLTADDWDAHDTLICVSTGKRKEDEERLRYPADLFVRSPEQMEELFGDLPKALENTRQIADRCSVELDFSSNHAPLVGIRRRTEPIDLVAAPEGSGEWFEQRCSTLELIPLRAGGGSELDSGVDSGVDSGTVEELTTGSLEQQCDDALRQLTEWGLIWRYGREGITKAHRDRLARELTVLSDKKISAYFLIVWDFVNEARRRGIPAMARGSGVGTMVGYLLGLSNACPVRYGLLFERFTDPDRSEYPDIDIDLCQDGRQEILEYVRGKYGYFAQIITFGTMKARAAVRDVGRVHNLPLPDVDRVCKLIGDQLGITLDDAIEREPELRDLCRDDPKINEVIATARRLEGMTRHCGVHAAGVVIATQPLDNLIPLAINKQQGSKDVLVTQWDGPTIERMGLLKMDFLGLKTLSVLKRARQLVRASLDEETIVATVRPGGAAAAAGAPPAGDSAADDSAAAAPVAADPLDLDRIDFTDQRVLDLYRRGDTAGTFQFESDGMRNLLLKMHPDRLEDLVAANALFRPGPMALIDDYCSRKNGQQEVPRVHEIVDRFTADTHGIMVYQEQVMQIVHELGGLALREAYTLIKAISKKKHETINAARARFVKGAEERGLVARKAEQLFELILRFAGYGFNKSHSVGYSILAYQTAYLKTYFPIQFMAAVLTYESDNTDKLALYLDESRRVLLPDGSHGVEVKPPDINLSRVRFQVVYQDGEEHDASSGHIRFGLSAVKGVGEKAVEAILTVRDQDGPFHSLLELCERVPLQVVNRSTLEALIKAGALDSLHGEQQRAAMLDCLESVMRTGQRAAQDREVGQSSLFGGPAASAETGGEFALPKVPPWSVLEQLRHEKAALGFFASHDPLEVFREDLERYRNATLAEASDMEADMEVVVGVMVSSIRTTRTRKGRNPGQKMAMLNIVDSTQRMEAVAFADAYEKLESMLVEDAVLFVIGRVDRRRSEASLVVSNAFTIEEAPLKLSSRLEVLFEGDRWRARQDQPALRERLEEVKAFLRSERKRVNGNGVDLVIKIRLEDQVVATAQTEYRLPLRADLVGRLGATLGDLGSCSLLGPGPPRLMPQEQHW